MKRHNHSWRWNEAAEEKYQAKRVTLARMGYQTDEEVAQFFVSQGVAGVTAEDVRPMMLDALTATAAEQALAELS